MPSRSQAHLVCCAVTANVGFYMCAVFLLFSAGHFFYPGSFGVGCTRKASFSSKIYLWCRFSYMTATLYYSVTNLSRTCTEISVIKLVIKRYWSCVFPRVEKRFRTPKLCAFIIRPSHQEILSFELLNAIRD